MQGAVTIPTPNSFESAMSAITLAKSVMKDNPPQTQDQLDRLRWAVVALDELAVRSAGKVKKEFVW